VLGVALIIWKRSIVAVMAGWLLLAGALRLGIVRRNLIRRDRKFRLVGGHANTRRIDF
jgi:hypothetical protein